MTEVTDERSEAQSATEQVKEQVKSIAGHGRRGQGSDAGAAAHSDRHALGPGG